MWARLRGAEERYEFCFDFVTDDMLPPAGFFVHEMPFHADHIGKQAFGESMFADDSVGDCVASL
jgi:hypothetical protein